VLSGFTYKWNDAKLIITELKDFKGESSVSIRKGKKIVSYDYSVKLQWQIDMFDNDGTTIFATTKG
jgi:activator of HSP90 ATPase